ncbi:MAG: endonuclease/exonuclease/phosphatase family protein [Bacteroidaceae bacterium]|nr:endonuclease/exonuclease/phosphatase family protein [Bacteroidaceae bacterium]
MRTFRNILLLLLLVLTGILIILPYLPADIAGHFYYISLAALPLIGADIICLFAVRKQKVWRVAFLLFLISSLGWLKHYIPDPFSRVGASENTLTLVSWNVNLFGGGYQDYSNLAPAAALIKQQNPDIICLQERPHTNVMRWDSIRAAFSDYPYYVKNTREDEVLNLVVFSRYPLSNPEDHYFADTYNKFMQVDVQLGTQTLRLFNVHLQTTGIGEDNNIIKNAKKRNHQAQELARCVQESPHPNIVCGDFNDTRSSYAYRTIAKGLQDAAEGVARWQGTYTPFLKIDHILCSKDIKLQNYEVVSNNISDHKLQLVTLSSKL